jgi:hypothetical protein
MLVTRVSRLAELSLSLADSMKHPPDDGFKTEICHGGTELYQNKCGVSAN